MKNWVALGLLCIASAAYATDKTPPAKTPPPSTAKPAAKPAESSSAAPKTLTVEEDKNASQDPKNKKTDTKAKEATSKPTM
ncbi:hypothetical protein [Myxococcus stipitatus]|uniref:hypothetical protein n=1 Tax=Myxococcus stipitatus TaxID=83455 RepID=UPI0030CCC0C0